MDQKKQSNLQPLQNNVQQSQKNLSRFSYHPSISQQSVSDTKLPKINFVSNSITSLKNQDEDDEEINFNKKDLQYELLEDGWVIDTRRVLGNPRKTYCYVGFNEKNTKKKVFIKKIHFDFFAYPDKYKQIRALLKSLRKWFKKLPPHKNVVKVIDLIITKEEVYYISEYCKQGNLSKYAYENKGTVPQQHVMFIFKQILQAYKHMADFQQEYRHMFLMPSYILLTGEILKSPVKLDIGIGKILSLSYKYDNPKGFQYRSPQRLQEYLNNIPYRWSYKCDTWSFGIILYEMLEGTLPFIGVSDMEFFNTYQQKQLQDYNTYKKQIERRRMMEIKEYNGLLKKQAYLYKEVKDYLVDIVERHNEVLYMFTKSIPRNLKEFTQKLIQFSENPRLESSTLIRVKIVSELKLPEEEREYDELMKQAREKEFEEERKKQQEKELRKWNRFWD